MPDNLLTYNEKGEPSGPNLKAIKNWAINTTPYHSDLKPYRVVHISAKAGYLEELTKQATTYHITIWSKEVDKALEYLEQVVDCILEADETSFQCDLRRHRKGERCPNRKNLVIPDPTE